MITLTELMQIKRTNEKNGLSERRIRCKIADAVKKSGMVTKEYAITKEGAELIKKVWAK